MATAETESASHSGKLLVRMPRTLHAELAAAADREGVSLNAFIVGALGGAVGWRSGEPETAAPRPSPVRAVGGEQPRPAPPATSRTLSVALVINLVVVVLAAAAAVALVIAAWPA
jgi:hypothetical protein